MNQNQITAALQGIMPQAYAGGWFPSLATLQTLPTLPQGPTGNAVATEWTNVEGVVNIPCKDAPPSLARVQATEVKAVEEIMAKGLRHVLLNQCFTDAPNWAAMTARMIIDGLTYEVLGAENDSNLIQTRVDLQLVQL
jgi:hypothetical protein